MLAERTNIHLSNRFSDKVYWLNKLAGNLPETTLITDYIRPSLYCKKNQFVQFELSERLSQAVIQISNNSYSSIYLFLLSAIEVLLENYTGDRDLIVGIPNYRTHPDIQDSANRILPLRTHVSQDLTFKELLLQVKDSVINAYLHQQYPIDRLVQLLKIPRYQNRCSIFDVIVLLENIHPDVGDIDLKNDLTISFVVKGDRIHGKIDYSDSLFRDETIKLFANYYINVVECVVEQLSIKLADVVFLKEGDRHQILKDFNDSHRAYSLEQTLNELFEKKVEQNPTSIAAVWEDTRITYHDLNSNANQIANLLQDLGLKPGEFVGILKGRDINFLIAILAIHKAGGAYVPIDSTYPVDRIQYMLSDSEVKFVLTDCGFMQSLTSFVKTCSALEHIICLDAALSRVERADLGSIRIHSQQDFDRFSKENLPKFNRAIAPAYMLYTSGSTGLPKGAVIRHDGAVNHIYAQLDALNFNGEFSFLQSAPASSDISVWQFLAPLITGGKTVVIDTETVCDPEKLLKVLQTEKITLAELVPVILKGLLEYVSQLPPHQRALPELKVMMVTGEYVSVELINQWLRVYPSIKIANAYGPTEAADDITQLIIDAPLPENLRTVPIGKPLANLRLYVLNEHMQPTPIGVPGEICVSGVGVGNGYWKNEEKTRLSFVPNPFSSIGEFSSLNDHFESTEKHSVIYKTGDLGRWLPDGNLEFLGRIDHQVKIRGFRIELGEIEALLVQHQSVREAVVVVRENTLGDPSLVAYLVESLANGQLSTEPSTTPQEQIQSLRNVLRERLPEYIVPSAFVWLEDLPLTPSGKVDRQALPAPDQAHPELERRYVAPSTSIETAIAEIWQQILGIEQVGIHDNFFELGGHSLLFTQLFTRLRNTFGVNISLRRLVGLPTIANIAQDIHRIQTAPSGADAHEEPTIDFEAEASLDSDIQPGGIPYDPTRTPNAIFLTGSTGFLGTFLLYELLQQTKADIYCLVRSSTSESGQKKIQDKLKSCLLWDDAFSDRIIPVMGDLSQPLLGLSQQQFQQLAQQLDAIYHSGALVNPVSPYPAFKAANVLGTQEVLRLASQAKVKPVHFVSSTGVISSGNLGNGAIRENESLDRFQMPSSGYAQSKWVAEKLVAIARDRGLPVCVYRPGFITGHSKTGVCNTDDMIYRMIKGCIQLKSMPDLDVSLDLNPCDYVSQAAVYLSQQAQSLGQVFHLVNPQPLSMREVFHYLYSFGYPMEFVDYATWRSTLVREGTVDNALYPLIPIFAEEGSVRLEGGNVSVGEETVPSSRHRQIVQPFDANNTLTGLATSSITCPVLNDELLGTYISHLIQAGFLPAPSRP